MHQRGPPTKDELLTKNQAHLSHDNRPTPICNKLNEEDIFHMVLLCHVVNIVPRTYKLKHLQEQLLQRSTNLPNMMWSSIFFLRSLLLCPPSSSEQCFLLSLHHEHRSSQ